MLDVKKPKSLKKYIWFYVGVVAFVISFFIITSLYFKPKPQEKKLFLKDPSPQVTQPTQEDSRENRPKFKLLDRS